MVAIKTVFGLGSTLPDSRSRTGTLAGLTWSFRSRDVRYSSIRTGGSTSRIFGPWRPVCRAATSEAVTAPVPAVSLMAWVDGYDISLRGRSHPMTPHEIQVEGEDGGVSHGR